MQYCRCGVVFLVLLGLAACSKSDQSIDDQYLTPATTVSAIKVPADAQAPKQDPYYKVPAVTTRGETPPSITPPSLSQASSAKQATATQKTVVSATKKHETLILNSKTSWGVLGKALAKDPSLKVVDHDFAAKTYYVLDTTKTSGAIKKKTPVYLVTLKSIAAGALVTVTDEKGGKIDVTTYNKIVTSIKSYIE